MAQQPQTGTGGAAVGQFGDTTYTKVFVGGLAWETQRETMRRYFEQFGEILEAVVITDKNTGRSKGYGFVTFRDPESAMRACVDASPIIDGRRANCNLASLGAHRSRPSTPQHDPIQKTDQQESKRRTRMALPSYQPFVMEDRSRFRIFGTFPTGIQSGYHGAAAFPQPGPYSFQQGFPYHAYGFSSYSQESSYTPNYYSNPYGGPHYPQIYAGPAGIISSPALYPYFQYPQPLQGSAGYPQAQNFSIQFPHIMQYPGAGTISSLQPQQYGGMVSIPTALPSTGMTLALPAGAVAAPVSHSGHLYPTQPHYTPGGGGSEQSSA